MRAARLVLPALLTVAFATGGGASLPATCASPCEIEATGFGYLPAAHVVANGGTVFWNSTDSTHVQADRALVGSSLECFATVTSPGHLSVPVRFDVVNGVVTATMPNATGVLITKTCLTTTELPDGSHELPYYCKLHPTMRGTLIVSA